ncbi:hypothetical protein [Sulfurimonas sp.]
MIKLNILTQGLKSYNGIAFLTPIFKNIENLKDLGIVIEFYTTINNRVYNCDVLLIDSKFYANEKKNNGLESALSLFSTFKSKVKKVIFFDLGDGSSAWALDVLPYVDNYFKSYVYKDKRLYNKKLYGTRIWTDYYNKKSNIEDENPQELTLAKVEDLNKIKLSYNSSLADYSLHSKLYNNSNTKYFKLLFPLGKHLLDYPKISSFTYPSVERVYNISCRMNTNYRSQGVAYHRILAADVLKNHIKYNRINRELYFQEMQKSKIVVSPFGWGEVNYKDYEALLCGSLILKPNMDHLDTFPNYFTNDNMLFYKWDYSDIEEKIEIALTNYKEYINRSINAQNMYKYYLLSKDAQEEFSSYFYKLVVND